MIRCVHCETPNPDSSRTCVGCGRPCGPVPRDPFLRREDLWQPEAFLRALGAAGILLIFRLSFGHLLTVGVQRREWAFLSYHLAHGTLLGLGLAWVRGERRPQAWLAWLAAGWGGGLLSEGLELWYLYRNLMARFSLLLWQYFGLAESPALIYRVLQGLRLGGTLLPLLGLALKDEKRLSRGLFTVLAALGALALRIPVRGFLLDWRQLGHWAAWEQIGLYSASALLLYYGLGQRALTESPPAR